MSKAHEALLGQRYVPYYTIDYQYTHTRGVKVKIKVKMKVKVNGIGLLL